MSTLRPGSRGDLRERTRADTRRFAQRQRPSFWRSLALIGSVGWPIALGSVGGALAGRLLDRHFGSGVRYTLILLTLCTAVATYAAFHAVRRHGR